MVVAFEGFKRFICWVRNQQRNFMARSFLVDMVCINSI